MKFLQYVRSRGVTPIYITNRDHKVETATRDVLGKLGVPDRHHRATRAYTPRERVEGVRQDRRGDSSSPPAIGSCSSSGDNFEDFAPGTQASIADRAALMDKYADYWGTKWIVLPNPTYGSWEQAITFGQGRLTDAQILAAKYRALRF